MTTHQTDAPQRRGPLDGIRILDLTAVIMGPFATQVLADQGADVVLVEGAHLDTNRVMGAGRHPELSGTSMNLLRNKRSVQLDLKTSGGQDDLHRLVRGADVLVTAMRPQAVTRLGLDFASLREVNPAIIVCQAQGFPLDSDLANEPAYDDIIQAATGVSDVMERVMGRPGLAPTIFADKVCGLVIAQAVTAALLHRERTGQGQRVEVAMSEAMTAFMLAEHGDGAILEPPEIWPGQEATGYKRLLTPERRPHATRDGQIHLFPYLPKHYAHLFAAAGVEGADDDPRYVDRRAALQNSESLYRDVRRIAVQRTTEDWLTFCRDEGIPATRVATLQDLVDPLPIAEHPAVGPYRVIPPLARFDEMPFVEPRPAPLLGEQTEALLAEVRDSP
jgi:crotonobetainyl-CoA:carnitine CoA-transferase CaiB-like acyl-CoA transferase